jgi:hypothetical protein
VFLYSTDPFNTDEMARKGDKTEKSEKNKFCPAYSLIICTITLHKNLF